MNAHVDDQAPGELRRRSVTIAGHRTSISIENAFWWELKRIARNEGKSLNRLIAEIDAQRKRNLSSTLRVFVLEHALHEPLRGGNGDVPPESHDQADQGAS